MRWDRIGEALGAFGRRLALQALVSSIVMTGIGLVSRDDFAVPRAVLAEVGLDWAVPPAPASAVAAVAPAGMGAAAVATADPVPANDGKASRLPGPHRPDAVAAAEAYAAVEARPERTARERPARMREADAPPPVVLFTQCAPACESRDPLILAASLAPVPLPAVPPPPPRELPPPQSLAATEDGSLLDTAAALPGRALGAAASLVGWGG